MSKKIKIEIFSAGCPACEDAVNMVNRVATGSCEISILDMHQTETAFRAKSLGIKRVPAIVINGKLAECCANQGPDEAVIAKALHA